MQKRFFWAFCKKSVLILTVLCGLVAIIGTGSDEEDNQSTSSNSNYQSATLKHEGFDFSTGQVPADWQNADGDTVNWVPSPSSYPTGVSYGDGVWFRAETNTSSDNYSKDMGQVSLDSVTTIPTSWDGGSGVELPYLSQNHVYVVKCKDGYAKFLVKSIDLNTWDVEVEFAYTGGTTF